MQKIVPALTLALILTLTPSVLAQNSTSSATPNRITTLQGREERVNAALKKRTEIRDQLREKMASKEAALKQRLQAFKDQRKAVIAQRVSDNLNKVNQNVTAEQTKRLSKLSEILGRIEQQQSSQSGNVATVSAAITEAQAAITEAQDAVTTQSQNDYTLTLSNEQTARAEAKAMRDKLHTDLKSTHELVLAAKDAVVAAYQAAKGVQ